MRSRADSTVGGDKVRILVLGDSGVGKTSLVHLICQGEELKKPRSTVGCAINMTVHEPRGNPGSSCFVEFWDVGGSPRFDGSRQVFYSAHADGIILVHDLGNSVSRRNLVKWRDEWTTSMSEALLPDGGSYDILGSPRKGGPGGLDAWAGGGRSLLSPPTLTIGNKRDLLGGGGGGGAHFYDAEDGGGHELVASCRAPTPGEAQRLAAQVAVFIDRVLEQRARAHRSGTEGPAGAHGFVPHAHAHAHPGGGTGGAGGGAFGGSAADIRKRD